MDTLRKISSLGSQRDEDEGQTDEAAILCKKGFVSVEIHSASNGIIRYPI